MERYEKKIAKIHNYKNQKDLEIIHSDRDDVYEKFIKEIGNGKLNNLEEIKKIANLINTNLIKKYKEVWFA